MSRRQTAIMKSVTVRSGKCELCGSSRNLEAHHIIPIDCGGQDTENNLICVCHACHAKLTPHSELIKISLDKCKYKGYIYQTEKDKFMAMLWEHIMSECEKKGYWMETVLDALDSF